MHTTGLGVAIRATNHVGSVCARILGAQFGFVRLFGLLMLFCFCDLQAAGFIGVFL
jgi:hypothetical protein